MYGKGIFLEYGNKGKNVGIFWMYDGYYVIVKLFFFGFLGIIDEERCKKYVLGKLLVLVNIFWIWFLNDFLVEY